jgi:hypothetical protein
MYLLLSKTRSAGVVLIVVILSVLVNSAALMGAIYVTESLGLHLPEYHPGRDFVDNSGSMLDHLKTIEHPLK